MRERAVITLLGAALGLWGFTPLQGNAQEDPDPLSRSYRIEADFRRFEKGSVPIALQVEIENRGIRPVEELLWILYPNRYRNELPGLNDLNYRRVYIDGFSAGGLDSEEVRVGENGSRFEPIAVEGIPPGTIFRLPLPAPLRSGERTVIFYRGNLRIPEKYGSFGHARGVLTLSGGWYPYIASFRGGRFRPEDLPPRADWRVAIQRDRDLILNGRFFPLSPGDLPTWESTGAREVSLLFGKDLKRSALGGRSIRPEIFLPAGFSGEGVGPLRELLIRWMEFVERHPELTRDVTEPVSVFSPLREALAEDGEGMTYLSDRAFRLFPTIRQYHTPPIVRGLFRQLLLPRISRRESSRDYDWIARAVAWSWTERFMRENAYVHRDARTLGPMKVFSFLPVIDQVIYAPQFAFLDVFYDFIYPIDPLRDDPLRFNHSRTDGRTIFAHLQDEVGAEEAERIADEYTRSEGKRFVDVAEGVAGKGMEESFRRWIDPRPAVNYVLGKPSRRTTSTGYAYDVTVRRESDRTFREPVELGVVTKKGERFRLLWNDPKESHTFTFESESKIASVEVDPRGRLWETKLSDNRIPPRYKLVLTDWILNYDFNNRSPEAYVATQFRRSHGGRNRYNFSGSYASESYGASIGYTRLFGRLIDRLRLSHGLSFGFGFTRLGDDTALAERPPISSIPVRVGSAGNVTTLSVSYGFGNQLSLTNPLEGGGGAVSASWGSDRFGGDSNYYRLGLGGSWVFRLHPSHLLAARFQIGFSGPEGIPSQIQYFLGGLSGIRGLSFDDDRFKGKNLLLSSLEYRHFLLADIDVNLGILRVREIQGAFWTDAGRVTDTVAERAARIAFGSSPATTRGDLFDLRHFQTDVGYGVRFHIEWLGVNPALFRFDAAKSLTESGDPVRFYFGVTQSF
jgi:hypothetical protein